MLSSVIVFCYATEEFKAREQKTTKAVSNLKELSS